MKLLQQYEAACQAKHLARRTVQTYTRWVEEFVRYQRPGGTRATRRTALG